MGKVDVNMDAYEKKEKIECKKILIEDILKPGWYTLFIAAMAEFMILSQLGNVNFMVYSGLEARPVACGDTEIDSSLNVREACEVLAQLQKNESCEPKLDAQFYSANIEFGYYCDRTRLIKNSISYQTIGVILGSIVFGQLSDSYGRKPFLIVCLVGCAVMGFASSFANNLSILTVLRGFSLFFTGGQIAVMLVYLVETLPMKDRMWINAIVTWSPNYMIFATIAYLCQRWRLLAQVSSALIIPAIVMSIFIRESPRWLIQKKKYEGARKAMKSIIRFEERKAECDDTVKAIITNERKASAESSNTRKYYLYHLFSTKVLAFHTLVLAFSYLTTSVLNYGIFFNMGGVAGSIFINNGIIGLFRWLVNVVFGLLDYKIKWFGRKVIHNLSMAAMIIVVTTISLLIILNLGIRVPQLLRYLTLSISIIASHLFIVLNISSNELFPTPIRNIAFSFLQVINRAGIVLAPQLFVLADYWDAAPYVTMFIASSLALLLHHFTIPETKNRPLQHNMPRSKVADAPIGSCNENRQNTDSA